MMSEQFILLVEDNPDDEALMLRALSRNQFRCHVVVAHDGAEALDFLFAQGSFAGRNAAELPLAVLLDLKLPRIGGLEVLRRMRLDARTAQLPVIILTSSDEERDLSEVYRLGASCYVRRTADFTSFSEAVRQIGTGWLNLSPAGEK